MKFLKWVLLAFTAALFAPIAQDVWNALKGIPFEKWSGAWRMIQQDAGWQQLLGTQVAFAVSLYGFWKLRGDWGYKAFFLFYPCMAISTIWTILLHTTFGNFDLLAKFITDDWMIILMSCAIAGFYTLKGLGKQMAG